MTGDSEPTIGEVVRRLDAISKQQERLLDELRQDRSALATTYVRRDVYDARHQALRDDIDDLEKRLERQDTFRRQVLAGSAVLVIGIVLNAVIALLSFTTAKGV